MADMTVNLIPLSAAYPDAVEHLLDLAFGADRFSKTAYKLRLSNRPIGPLSWAIVEGDKLVGSIQCWPVRIAEIKLVLVGPVAVHPERQGTGIGKTLMQHMLEQAMLIGDPPMVMVGDAEYYGRFGFSADATGGWQLPGPWEVHRLLARNIGGAMLALTGMIEDDGHAL
jgi:predicted N-acetyltransferase YhbS